MCGICGVVSISRPEAIDEQVITSMASSLIHRGPDEWGLHFVRPFHEGQAWVAFGHRRLSIVDLSTGRQPLFNEDGTLALIANGEIYNYPELRPLLEGQGHRLATSSDCEAIVHLYEELGLEFVNKLAGMFAFALWDAKRQRLVLVRDRIGVKPLHYCQIGDTLLFGSEIKALLRHPLLQRRINLPALYKYLSFEYVPAPETILEGVKKLEPGQMLVWERGEIKLTHYWDLNIAEDDNYGLKEEDCIEQLEQLFERAVKRRLMSDVEVGVFLSGGVDSSLVAIEAQRHYPQPMRAFTIGFEDPSFDETQWAQRVAKQCGAEFYYEKLNEQKLLDVIPQLNQIMDEPMADPSVVPTYLLSKLTANSVKVALSGDGGDDFMAGYVTYPALKLIKYYQVLPSPLRHRINQAIARLPVKHRYVSLDFKLKQFMRGAGYSSEIMFFRWMGSFSDEEKTDLFLPQLREQLSTVYTYSDVIRYLSQSRLNRDLERILYCMIKLYLQDDILIKVDRASMANSLEVRSPFLDHELVEFVNRLPSRLKLRRFTTKYILKKMAERKLPKTVVHRKKKGFGIPIGRWLRHDLKELMTDYLSAGRIRREGFFDPKVVSTMVGEHLKGSKDLRKPLWTLLMFEMWYERWMR
ncbi:hypothetical protein AAU61_01105 [Desulfocarbo indianensis]|nr:hypothetical protein AAU61_01105 [Desulfocarbo indianensis]